MKKANESNSTTKLSDKILGSKSSEEGASSNQACVETTTQVPSKQSTLIDACESFEAACGPTNCKRKFEQETFIVHNKAVEHNFKHEREIKRYPTITQDVSNIGVCATTKANHINASKDASTWTGDTFELTKLVDQSSTDVQRSLSRQLYEALDDAGTSETFRESHQESARTLEILQQISNKLTTKIVYICGSRYEGSVTYELGNVSDVDTIFCHNTPVVLDPNNNPSGRTLLVVTDDWTPPGYVKLQHVEDGHPLTKRDGTSPPGTMYDVIGRLCNMHQRYESIKLPYMHGIINYIRGLDIHLAYKCENIPDHVRDWIYRKRRYGWPSDEQLETMSKMGCLFVGFDHWDTNYSEHGLGWRISFSLQERLLMSSLNPVQHKIYVTLKIIKTSILLRNIDGSGNDFLSSYHLKTCILYAVEETPAGFWTPGNMINCILYCLRLLLQWIENGYCPNYFIEEQNLFSKKCFPSVRYNIRDELKRLIQMEHHLLYRLESDGINKRLMRGRDINTIEQNMNSKEYQYNLKLKSEVIYNNYTAYFSLIHMNEDVPYTLGVLQSTDIINEHSYHDKQSTVNNLYPWLHLHIAKTLSIRAMDTDDNNISDMLFKRANEHFDCASETDVTSVRFAKASILYTRGRYEECRELLLEIERDLTTHVLSSYPYSTCPFYNIKQRDTIKLFIQKSVSRIMKHHIATCVVFTRSESKIAPRALQYEMYRPIDQDYFPCTSIQKENWFDQFNTNRCCWLDFAVVEARVYLYFLQYLIYKELQMDSQRQEAFEKLKAKKEMFNFHIDTTCNILGWIYLQQNNTTEAEKCFRESLRFEPHINAALFHLEEMQLLSDSESDSLRRSRIPRYT